MKTIIEMNSVYAVLHGIIYDCIYFVMFVVILIRINRWNPVVENVAEGFVKIND